MRPRKLRAMLLTVVAGVTGIRLLFAYIDPNTGGMLFQLLAVIFSFFTGLLLFFSRKIRRFVARTKRFLRDQ